MMSDGRGIFVDLIKEEFVFLVFCLEDVCFVVLVCLCTHDITSIVEGRMWERASEHYYHVLIYIDRETPCNIIIMLMKGCFFVFSCRFHRFFSLKMIHPTPPIKHTARCIQEIISTYQNECTPVPHETQPHSSQSYRGIRPYDLP